MRRAVRSLLGGKSDKKAGQAAVAEDADDVVDGYFDDAELGLDVWVQGINPTVEYISLSFQSHPPAFTALEFVFC
jgi:hypothetical protein